MEKDIEKNLDDFLSDNSEESFEEKVKKQKKELLKNKTGLIERVDRQYVTEDGRILLREQY